MDKASAMFSEQATADFRVARSIPQHDLSGQALGISMFLAQQSIEKQLKAMILRINEAMAFTDGKQFLHTLSHQFYPSLHEVREKFVRKLGMPPAPVLRLMDLDTAGSAFESNERVLGDMGRVWKEYAAPACQVRMYVWKHSLHVRLDARELDAANRFLHKSLVGLPGALGKRGAASRPPGKLTNDFVPPPPMRGVINSQEKTSAAYAEYVGGPLRQGMTKRRDGHLTLQDRIFSEAGMACLGSLPRVERERAAARLVAEFAFEAASPQAYRYVTLYPHNLLGRYPERLPDGKTTPEVYGSRVDIVLHRLCNEVRFSLDLLRGHASKLDELCRLGSEHGYW